MTVAHSIRQVGGRSPAQDSIDQAGRTNDWTVVALDRFDALGLVPFNVNPHYLETDPAMAPHSETRDDQCLPGTLAPKSLRLHPATDES
jgi:dipeptidase E